MAATFGFSKDAAHRNKRAHVTPSLVRLGTRLREREQDRPAEALIVRMEGLYRPSWVRIPPPLHPSTARFGFAMREIGQV
ncbi:MAG: hypothetical protein ACRDIX_08385 [Actinomycetota bacterium]